MAYHQVLPCDRECARANGCPGHSEHCDVCGKRMIACDDDARCVDGDWMCEDCYNERYFECAECGTTTRLDDAFTDEETGERICEDCYKDFHFTCDRCHKQFRITDDYDQWSDDGMTEFCPACRALLAASGITNADN